MPSNASSARSVPDGGTQANGAATMPNTSAATVCVVTSTVWLVPRRKRVEIIDSENVKLPISAISAGQDSAVTPGRRHTITPMKPASTALQRRQPTGSPSMVPAIAVTKIGPAR